MKFRLSSGREHTRWALVHAAHTVRPIEAAPTVGPRFPASITPGPPPVDNHEFLAVHWESDFIGFAHIRAKERASSLFGWRPFEFFAWISFLAAQGALPGSGILAPSDITTVDRMPASAGPSPTLSSSSCSRTGAIPRDEKLLVGIGQARLEGDVLWGFFVLAVGAQLVLLLSASGIPTWLGSFGVSWINVPFAVDGRTDLTPGPTSL